MPAASSNIHETAILFWINRIKKTDESYEEIYRDFSDFSKKISGNKIQISKIEFNKYLDTFERGLELSSLLKEKLSLTGATLKWIGLEDHKNDSADIEIDSKKISLKDESNIVRNNGFEQLLNTFVKKPLKNFKDPFLEFAPKLSSSYISVIIQSNLNDKNLIIKDNNLVLDGEVIAEYKNDPKSLISLDLKGYLKLFKLKDIKQLVKNFKESKYQNDLFEIRKSIVMDVSSKVVSVLNEGLYADSKHAENELKKLLQFSSELKYFGYSSRKFHHVGVIVKNEDVNINILKLSTELSKLKIETTGLQINLYTDIEINICDQKPSIIQLENQLRYKHRTFSCAPEANTHLVNALDWKVIYPLIKKFV